MAYYTDLRLLECQDLKYYVYNIKTKNNNKNNNEREPVKGEWQNKQSTP